MDIVEMVLNTRKVNTQKKLAMGHKINQIFTIILIFASSFLL